MGSINPDTIYNYSLRQQYCRQTYQKNIKGKQFYTMYVMLFLQALHSKVGGTKH